MTENKNVVTQAKIAAVTNPNQLAINAGSNKGVKKDDIVVLLDRVEVRDPDGGNLLGAVRYAKLRLRVVLVEELFSVATVTDRWGGSAVGSGSVLSRIKNVTTDPFDDSPGMVPVTIGQNVEIRRPRTEPPE